MQKILTLILLLTLMLNVPVLFAMEVDSTETLIKRVLASQESLNTKTYPVILVNKSDQALLVAPLGKTVEILHQDDAHPVFFSTEESSSPFTFSSPKGLTALTKVLGHDKKYILFTLLFMQKRQWVCIEEKRAPLPINHVAILIDKCGYAKFIDRTNVEENCYQAHLLSEGSKDTRKTDQMRELKKIKASLKNLEDMINH